MIFEQWHIRPVPYSTLFLDSFFWSKKDNLMFQQDIWHPYNSKFFAILENNGGMVSDCLLHGFGIKTFLALDGCYARLWGTVYYWIGRGQTRKIRVKVNATMSRILNKLVDFNFSRWYPLHCPKIRCMSNVVIRFMSYHVRVLIRLRRINRRPCSNSSRVHHIQLLANTKDMNSCIPSLVMY